MVAEWTSDCKNVAKSIQNAQAEYKKCYDWCIHPNYPKKTDWIMVGFLRKWSGAERRLSRPWHEPYILVDASPTGVTAEKVYACKMG